jgi:glycosyltransferase involved in cell wall biosynthesis
MPVLSYVIPVYNGEKFIERAVCSTIDQTADSKTIIVVDDGSTDNTINILSKYEKNITLLKQKNAGPSAARNHGFSAVNTDMVCFVDADDYVIGPHRQAIEYSYDKDVDIIIGLAAVGNDNTITLSRTNKFEVGSRGTALLKHFVNGYYVQTATLCWSTSFLKNIGGWDETLTASEDIELAVRAFAHDPNVMISNAPGWVVWHDHDSLERLTRMSTTSATSFVRAHAKYLDIVKSKNLDEDTINHVLRGCMRDGRTLYLNGYPSQARELFSMAQRMGYKTHHGPRMESILAASFGTEKTLAARRAIGRLKRSILDRVT